MHDIRPYLPELFEQPGTLLYIGARPDAHSWLDELYQSGNYITVLEVWEENFIALLGDNRIKEVKLGDVKEAALDYYDYIFWWHGPEHILQADLAGVIEKLESKTRKIVAMACPYGVYSQGAHNGNPYETHRSTLYPIFFEWLEYKVATDGKPDQLGSEIVAWKHL